MGSGGNSFSAGTGPLSRPGAYGRLTQGNFVYQNNIRMEFDFSKVDGFEWDIGNLTKNPQKHRISNEEAEEIFFRNPWVADASRPDEREIRWAAIGKSERSRVLRVVFTVRGRKLRVISARMASRQETDDYEKALRERG
jgi:uncharacterized protein